MPKWDGIRAVGIYYCAGHLIIKDVCGRIESFNVNLPFDNDMILQFEALPRKGENNGENIGYYYVITELLAVLIKSPNTMYHVYGRNNIRLDTGRNAGNVVTSIAIKTQFNSDTHVCSLYRSLSADVSLRVLSTLTIMRRAEWERIGSVSGPPTVFMKSVVNITDGHMRAEDVLDCLDAALGNDISPNDNRKNEVLSLFSRLLPPHVLSDPRFEKYCEGLIVAFVQLQTSSRDPEPANGYIKLKHLDTVDLELNLRTGQLTSSDSTEYSAKGLPDLDSLRSWSEHPSPIRNQRIIAEFYYDGAELVYLNERYDKSRPDSDIKIKATNGLIYKNCTVKS